ncbi:hypothetical protein ABMA77_09855 [Halobacteriovorax sp. RZ-1]|uniref:hypothetical protein n=1 Tax=unclassified Halobacteriovorax TaxID=2639665 RepID=UPI0037114424
MILLKFAILYFALIYSTIGFAQGSQLDSLLRCSEVAQIRCLEVQEYGQDFVGPIQEETVIQAKISEAVSPSIRELICCEDDEKLRKSIVGHIFDQMKPDDMIVALIAHKSVEEVRGPSSVDMVYNDDRFVGPKLPNKK